MMSEMKMITASELRADIKKGLHGVYLFCGPEEYMISAYTDMVRQSVTGGDETAQTFSVLSIDCSKEQGGSGQQQLDALTTLWQEPQGYLHIVISHEELDEAEALLAQAEAMAAQGDSQSLYPVLAELRGQFRLIAETQRISAKNIF